MKGMRRSNVNNPQALTEQIRAQLEADTKRFLDSGGAVQEIDPGVMNQDLLVLSKQQRARMENVK